MVLILILWFFLFCGLFVLGFTFVKVFRSITGRGEDSENVSVDQFFFTGFLILSSIAGILSVIFPIDNKILFFVSFITLVLFLINFSEIINVVKDAIKRIPLLNKFELFIVSLSVFFILTAVVHNITLYDTGLYHNQSIQWIRSFPVIPGLGNIHGRFAFNSMFFVISGLFTVQFKEILVFPLNGLCYLVLFFKLVVLFKKEITKRVSWKATFYGLLALASLFILLPDLNSPSPDIICAILIIYLFAIIIDDAENRKITGLFKIILVNMLVFSCISFKLSSLFISLIILMTLNQDILKRILISLGVSIIFLSAFFIRNYYLSGYLIYPIPGIDIFNMDWKIPLDSVLAMKSEIEGFAKIWTMPYPDVLNMKISEWIFPWFKLLNLNCKILLAINVLSIFSMTVMLLKKDFFLAKIQFIILINLFFWFIMAPDPRFAYGFIIVGFSLTLSYTFKLLESASYSGMHKYIRIGLAGLLFLLLWKRIIFPTDTFRNPMHWIFPASFETVATKTFKSNFEYLVPEKGDQCFNADIPCVPYPLENVVLRGERVKDGFKVVKKSP